ncbi:translation initiation factor IF-1 [bacterium]|nr:translation initiation factor IF-1 [bacterium]
MGDKNKTRERGIVVEALPNTNFRVKLDNGLNVLCHLSGKMRLYYIKVFPGDKVEIEIDPQHPERGRIVRRL